VHSLLPLPRFFADSFRTITYPHILRPHGPDFCRYSPRHGLCCCDGRGKNSPDSRVVVNSYAYTHRERQTQTQHQQNFGTRGQILITRVSRPTTCTTWRAFRPLARRVPHHKVEIMRERVIMQDNNDFQWERAFGKKACTTHAYCRNFSHHGLWWSATKLPRFQRFYLRM